VESLKRLTSWFSRHKETLSVLFSSIALLVSGVTYSVANWWNVHEVQVAFVDQDFTSTDPSFDVVVANSGKRTEVIFRFEIQSQRETPKGSTTVRNVFPGTPVIVEPGSVVPRRFEHKAYDWNAVVKDLKIAEGTHDVTVGVFFQYINARGELDEGFVPLGTLQFMEGQPQFFTPNDPKPRFRRLF
jgi:hypothetical protein